MGDNITNEIIINEYLSNFLEEKELAEYLCIDVSKVEEVLTSIEDERIRTKVDTHKKLILLYSMKVKENKDNTNQECGKDQDKIGSYIVNKHCSIRECAKHFGMGKSTVFDYIHEQLPLIDIVLYKNVFDVLMENKSFSTNSVAVREQVLKCYDLLREGHTIKEISEKLGLGWNTVERNLNKRLKKIDEGKYELAKMLLEQNKLSFSKEIEHGK